MQKPLGARLGGRNWTSAARVGRALLALGAVTVLGAVPGFATAASSSTTTTFEPVADARVQEANPTTSYGLEKRLSSDGDAGRPIESVLRFDLSGLAGTVESAKLRLYAASDPTKDGPAAYPADSSWSETAVTWSTRPQATGSAVGDLGAVAAGSWVELDVTSIAAGKGVVSVLLKQPGTDGVIFYSREKAGYAPQLVVTSSEGEPSATTPPPPPPPSGWSAGTVRAIYASWNNGATVPTLASLGFNAVNVSPYPDRLDRLAEYGMRGLVWLGGYNEDTCEFNEPDSWVVEKVTAIRDHSAVLAFEVDNEPHATLCASAPAQMKARSDLVKSVAPGATTYLTLAKEFAAFTGTVDFVRISRYPCSYPYGCIYSKITDRVAEAKAAGWTRFLGGTQTAADAEYYRIPAAAELVEIDRTWRDAGAEGYVAWAWDDHNTTGNLSTHPELWDTWRAINAA